MSPRPTLLLLVALVTAVSACTPDGDGASTTTQPPAPSTTTSSTTPPTSEPPEDPDSPVIDPASCEFDVPAGRTVECGWLAVPADRSDPDSGTVRLHVAVFASESSSPATPVVYLEGGPGGDSLELVPLTFEDRFAHLLADRDVVLFDQRGTGFSRPSLACPELRELGFELLDDDLPIDEMLRLQDEAIAECRDRLIAEGADLDAYNSAESAADVADLRIALGYDEWNLYGISYGTRLALTVMRDHPEGIRSVVLDSVYPPQVDLISSAPANLDRSLDVLFAGCAADLVCNAAYPDLEATFYDLITRLDEAPLRAPVTDVFTGTVYDAFINGGFIASIVFQGLYSADAIIVLPQMIANVAAGEDYELSVLASSFLANGEFVSAGMQFSVQCNEEAPFTDEAAVEDALAEFPELRGLFDVSSNLGPRLLSTCAAWGAGSAEALENAAIASNIPALVLAGEYDPITPPEWSALAASTLAASTLVEFPGVGHGPSADQGCPQAVLRSFLAEPSMSPDLDCLDGMTGPAFATPGTETPEVVLVEFSQSAFGSTVTGVRPDGWESAGPGVWARGISGFDQTALVQQYSPGASPDLLLGLLAQQFGLGTEPEVAEVFSTTGGEWSIYRGETVGAPVSVALLGRTEGTLLVILVTPPAEQEALTADVLYPVLEALSVG